MKIMLKNQWVVKPAEVTWNGIVALSELDQIEIAHVQTIYYYRPSQDYFTSTCNILKTSLSKALVHFYPLAGRLRWIDGSRLELDCDASGAVLTEAESDAKLDDLGDQFSLSPDHISLFPHIDYTIPISEIPLLFVKLTKFKCGAIALSFAISHAVVDGQGGPFFLSEWARLARGEPLMFAPFHDRKVLKAGEPPIASPTLDEHVQFNPPPLLMGKFKNETKGYRLKLTKHQVETLREKANQGRNLEDSKERSYTRYEVMTAHIWRCACKARGHKFEQLTSLSICVNIRSKMHPPLPKTYFGNAIIDVNVVSVSGDITSSPLEYVARKVRETIEMVTSDYVNSAINFLIKQQDLSKYQDIHRIRNKEGPSYGNPNLAVISWMSLPLSGLDFGWGKEIYMSPRTYEYDGDCVIQPGNEGDGSWIVAIALQVDHVEAFKKFFYEDIECLKKDSPVH
ncbi:spermidine hydroxycinnamoyl transferase-like [Capsicum chacoense]